MAFRLPTFNLFIHVWRGANPTTNPPDVITVGQLRAGDHINTGQDSTLAGSAFWEILFPPLIDIRDLFCPSGPDIAEAPAGSGRFYLVRHVDDIAKGFANEHRQATVTKFGTWPQPIP